MSALTIEQDGLDCIVTIGTQTNRVPNCNALKLANTLWNKLGDKYTQSEMDTFGFALKRYIW